MKQTTTRLALSFAATALFIISEPVTGQELETKTIEVNGVTLQYVEQGEGEPVVFLHGNVGSNRSWLGVSKAISEDHKFIALSLRYSGELPWPDQGEKFSVPTHAEDLAAFVEGLGLGPVHLVTYSYSGAVGVYAALDHPDLFRSMVHYEPSTHLRIIAPGERADAANKELADAFAARNEAIQAGDLDKAMEEHINTVFNIPGVFTERLTEVQRQNILQNKRILAMQPTETPPPVTCEMLADLDIPTLVLVGDQTWDIFKIVADRMVECMPNAEKVMIPGQTHGAPGLAPDLVGDAIQSFLDEQSGA